MICPDCAASINLHTERVSNQEGSKLDCPVCDSPLIVKDGRLYEFHTSTQEISNG